MVTFHSFLWLGSSALCACVSVRVCVCVCVCVLGGGVILVLRFALNGNARLEHTHTFLTSLIPLASDFGGTRYVILYTNQGKWQDFSKL